MSKYVLSTDGSIKEKKDDGEFKTVPKEEYSSKFIPLTKPVNYISNKPVTDAVYDRFPLSENGFISVDLQNRKRFFIDTSADLTNKSFNFLKDQEGKIVDKGPEEFEKTEYYVPYNSVSDLNVNVLSKEVGLQIFADDIDFFGFSSLAKDPLSYANETALRAMTIVDIFVPALIPIGIIAGLEMTQEVPDLKAYNLEFGKYVSYKLPFEGSFDIVSEAIEKNLNVLQRLMNFPKIKRKKDENLILYFLKFYVYLLLGYMSYFTPGLKFKIPTNLNDILNASFWVDIFSTIINADSPKHIYNLLIKKIGKSADFFSKTYNNEKGKNFLNTYNGNEEIDTFQKSISFYGTFFYRFIGERISVGEKQYLIDSSVSEKDKSFYATRRIENNKILKDWALLSNFSYGNNIVLKDQKKTWEYFHQNARHKSFSKQQYKILALEKEHNSVYMPFTFHDIRTNEIKNFHAFLENVNDSFSPSYTDSTGFGRMDPVKIYSGTSRSIGVDFWLISTNSDDCKAMWDDINWIVSLLYPTWSENEKLEEPDLSVLNKELNPPGNLKSVDKPFTKIPVASPLIRLRVGNLIISSLGKKQMELNTYIVNGEMKEGKKLFEDRSNVFNNNDIDKSSLFYPYYFLKETDAYDKNKNQIINQFSSYNYHHNPFAISQLRTGGVGLPGFIRSLNVNIDQNSLWDIEKDIRLPTIVKLSIQFDPIHDFKPGMSTFNKGDFSENSLHTHRFEIYPESK